MISAPQRMLLLLIYAGESQYVSRIDLLSVMTELDTRHHLQLKMGSQALRRMAQRLFALRYVENYFPDQANRQAIAYRLTEPGRAAVARCYQMLPVFTARFVRDVGQINSVFRIPERGAANA